MSADDAAHVRGRFRVLLVSCYELGHQPVGLASPLGFLREAGYEAEALDIAVEDLDETQLARADFVGISVPMHTALRLGMQVARTVRRVRPQAHVCFYGLYAPLNQQMLLSRGSDGHPPYADSVIGGEYEQLLVDAVRAAQAGDTIGAPKPALTRLRFSPPSREALPPLERYARLIRPDGESHLAGYVEASRGCLHECRHCPIPAAYGGRFFVVPRDVVLDDLERQLRAGAQHITFGDPDFLNGPGHVMPIVRALHASHPEVTFDITTKVEHILQHAPLFDELAELGCAFVLSAVESLSDEVLSNLDKGHDREEVLKAVHIVEGTGIPLRPSLVPFTPWTALDDYLEILEWIARDDLVDRIDPIQLAIRLLVPPGSLLLDHPAMQPHLGPLESESLTYRWSHPDPRMDALHREVQTIVERAADQDEPPGGTFAHICERAFGLAGRDAPPMPAGGSGRQPAPRLSEAWFCCAEPTARQKQATQQHI